LRPWPRSSISTDIDAGQAAASPQHYYDRIAAVYDSQRFACRCGGVLNKTELDIVGGMLHAGDKVLEVGTGTGRFSLTVAGLADKVVALDVSRSMILTAQAKSVHDRVKQEVSFVVGSGASLPFVDATFDVVIAVKVLSHFEDIDPFVAEISRVLKSGGRIIIDVPHQLASVYERFIRRGNIQSYRDYFHTMAEVRTVFRRHSISLSKKVTYSAVPSSLVHIALCAHPCLAPPSMLQSIIGSRRGFLSFVEGVRH